jgi:acyl-CoA reductase-like NAD-dependent aldehyde dehydrogenase
MNRLILTDFYSGKITENESNDVSAIIESLRNAQKQLSQWPIDRIIEILNEFALRLMNRRQPIHHHFPVAGLAYIADWCRATNLTRLLENTFSNRLVLDGYIDSEFREDRSYRALPRGLVTHWMAGNVPTLGFLSLVQGILTKNANLIKVASNADLLLARLLHLLASVKKEESQNGAELTRSIAVVRYDRSKKELGELISKYADVRFFWGSDESVSTLRRLPAKLHCTDLVFSNKTSFLVIDNHALRNVDRSSVTKRIAGDMSVFEQKACASPHTLFLETEDRSEVEKFAFDLKEALESLLPSMPKTMPSQKEVSAILNLRAQYDMFHQAWYSDGIEFTLLMDQEFRLGPPIGNRTLYIRQTGNLERIAELITPKVQSVGILAEPEKFEKLTTLYAEMGIQRFTNIGAMTQFESPWDGYHIGHHLVRWSSRPKQTTLNSRRS